MSWNLPQHTYEEIREVVVALLAGEEQGEYEINQWTNLVDGVGVVFARRERRQEKRLHPRDAELVRDVFWDLFRQGFITLGMNDSNPMWPWFRLSPAGKEAIENQSPFRFHSVQTFLAAVKKAVPDISLEALEYLEEAAASFYSGCLLASSVMLGVAAEAEFLRLLHVACANPTHSARFQGTAKEKFIRSKVTSFSRALKPILSSLPRAATEELDTNLSMIQAVLRVARNDAGHPTAVRIGREQAYVNLQLFVPFARQLAMLRDALK